MSSEVLISPLNIPENWRLETLRNISLKIGSGATPTGGQANYLINRVNYVLIRSQNVYDRHFSEDGLAFISNEQAKSLTNAQVQEDDILLNITGDGVTFGRACIIPKKILPACVNQHVSIIRVNKSISDPGYILSYLTHPLIKSYIESFNAGGSRRAITKGHIESFVIPIPPIETQREISSILQFFDDRIALLRETNATLEAIAQALFKSWFVDFDPVRAKAEGRQPEGMDAATAALFPDGFEESELGMVPRGWRIEKLSDVTCYINRGISPKYIKDHGVLVINQKCVRDFRIDYSKARRHDESARNIDGRTLENGDILINSTGVGTLGRVAQVLSTPERAIVDSHVTIVRANEKVDWVYLGIWLTRKQPEIENMGEGSTGQTELARSKISEMRIIVPAKVILNKFSTIVEPLKMRISNNEALATSLMVTRDALLPRLISGQLRLPEAQTAVEEALA